MNHSANAGLALELCIGGEVLPAQQEAEVVLRRDRLDLGAQADDRVAVDAGEQAAVAELFGWFGVGDVLGDRSDGGELSAHDLAQRLELAQAVFEVFGGQAAALAELLGGDRADDLHVSAGELDASVLAVGDANRRAGRQVELRLDRRFGEEQLDRRELLSGETGCEVAARRGSCAPLRDQLLEQRSVDREQGEIEAHEAEQQVVQLLGVADGRRGFFADALDRIDVEPAEVALLLGQAAAGHHGAGATLFERGVVEEAERVDVEDALGHR